MISSIYNKMVFGGFSEPLYEHYMHLLGAQTSNILQSSEARRPILVLGIGTGRCGSSTLWKILQVPRDSFVTHEHPPILPWNKDARWLDYHIPRFQLLLRKFSVVGDVSHWWLNYLPELVNLFDLRLIILKRPKDEVIRSFIKIKGGGGVGSINHWADHDGSYFKKNYWDLAYPSFSNFALSDCISKYYDLYYRLVGDLVEAYDLKNLQVTTSELSNIETCNSIMTFIELDPCFVTPVASQNIGSASDGHIGASFEKLS